MPNRNKGGFKPSLQTSVPTRFRCKVGGEWKPLDQFSNNQQQLIQRHMRPGSRIDAANSGMACKEHSGRVRNELRCELCNLIKTRDQFSKQALKNESHMCMRCTAWSETQEPNVTPTPLETGHISAEEESTETWGRGIVDSSDLFVGNATPRAPITDLASLGLEDLELSDVQKFSAALGNVDIESSTAESSQDHSKPGYAASASEKSVASSNLPPHLAFLPKPGAGEQPVPSGAFNNDDASISVGGDLLDFQHGQTGSLNQTVSTATTVREDREGHDKSRPIAFNAFDSLGTQHKRFKNPTNSSSSAASGYGFTEEAQLSNDSLLDDEWQTVPPKQALGRKNNDKWCRNSELRIPQSELKKQPMLVHTKSTHVNAEVDRQRRMSYCDSDDSDY